ncbi:hypothetical protein AVEN_224883-1 [Araneus ventricosus]|uniref:Uncharacterized protein n=1 Tax=Araneus ventricosus TaxID=182803 RepID=A0A4Y2PQH3_ARAVE|nr:hypothetical protein AVEN_224883-1 [Araneus ventricosus]
MQKTYETYRQCRNDNQRSSTKPGKIGSAWIICTFIMAEGGVPLQPVGAVQPEVEELDSLHMLFARDLVTYVMRRKVPGWSFSAQYSKPRPVTPFSYRIRHAVDFYLNKECINLDTLFHMAFINESIEYDGFVRVIKLAVESVLTKMGSYNDLLRFLSLLSHFTVLAYVRGVALAPYFALLNMKAVLHTYTELKGVYTEVFYGELGYNAQDLIHEDMPILFP